MWLAPVTVVDQVVSRTKSGSARRTASTVKTQRDTVSAAPDNAHQDSAANPKRTAILTNLRIGLLILLGLQLGATVEDLDVQLRRALHDLLALARGDVVGDLRRIPPVLHEEHIQLLDRADSEFVKAARQKVARLLVRTVTHVDQQGQALEPAPLPGVNTTRLAPALLDLDKLIGLVTLELVGLLLDDLLVRQRNRRHAAASAQALSTRTTR
mmetsp:Transcript_26945/g.87041  ORF Transcript_26945/g.87041 Transcript_26945/m.87041 type:complete len:212 (-) Transcript_26945:18-653(-)